MAAAVPEGNATGGSTLGGAGVSYIFNQYNYIAPVRDGDGVIGAS